MSALSYALSAMALVAKHAPLWSGTAEIAQGSLLRRDVDPKLVIDHAKEQITRDFVDQVLRDQLPIYKKSITGAGAFNRRCDVIELQLHVATPAAIAELVQAAYSAGFDAGVSVASHAGVISEKIRP